MDCKYCGMVVPNVLKHLMYECMGKSTSLTKTKVAVEKIVRFSDDVFVIPDKIKNVRFSVNVTVIPNCAREQEG